MGDFALLVANGANGQQLRINLAVLAFVPDLALPGALGVQSVPHGCIKRLVMTSRLQQVGGFTLYFFKAIAGNATESLVAAQDTQIGIGDQHAYLGLESAGSNTQVFFSCLALAYVPGGVE